MQVTYPAIAYLPKNNFTSLLSLGGLPPFLGFLPKRIVIQAIITNNIAPLATTVVVTSLITIYYYLKIS